MVILIVSQLNPSPQVSCSKQSTIHGSDLSILHIDADVIPAQRFPPNQLISFVRFRECSNVSAETAEETYVALRMPLGFGGLREKKDALAQFWQDSPS